MQMQMRIDLPNSLYANLQKIENGSNASGRILKIVKDGVVLKQGMILRTKSEQKAYLDGFEMCAECIEKYLSDEGKQKLECFLMAVRNAVEIEDEVSE